MRDNSSDDNNVRDNSSDDNNLRDNSSDDNNLRDNSSDDNNVRDNSSDDNNLRDNSSDDNKVRDNSSDDNNVKDNSSDDNNVRDNSSDDNNVRDNSSDREQNEKCEPRTRQIKSVTHCFDFVLELSVSSSLCSRLDSSSWDCSWREETDGIRGQQGQTRYIGSFGGPQPAGPGADRDRSVVKST